jgi:hypothetical protein
LKETEASAADREFGIKVQIDDEVFRKIMHWVNKSKFEVSGLGKVEYDKDSNILRVTDAILLPQKNTSTTTEIDSTAIGKAMFALRGSPRFWWHSHVDMPVFWSKTDIDTIKQLGSGGWFLSTVFNKRQEMKSAFCQNTPVRLLLENLPTEIVEYEDVEKVKQWDDAYDKNVENVAYTQTIYVPSREPTEYEKHIAKKYDFQQDEDVEDYIARLREKQANKVPVPKKNTGNAMEVEEATGQLILPNVFEGDQLPDDEALVLGQVRIQNNSIQYLALMDDDELKEYGLSQDEVDLVSDYREAMEDKEDKALEDDGDQPTDDPAAVNARIVRNWMLDREED